MVFSSLQVHEKEAFFSLLDEYFQSRPNIFANLSSGLQGLQANPAVSSAVNRASDATSKMVMGGLKNAVASNLSNASRPGANANANTTPSESELSSVANRVAAFSLQRNSHLSSPSTSNNAEAFSSAGSSLKKLGDNIDTSAAKNFFGSLRNANNPNSGASPSPPAFAPQQQQQQSFAPPVRRGVSNVSPSPRVAPPPIPASKPQEEKGDLADVLYDYNSGEAEDLKIAEGEVVLVTDRTSDDWWTGEVNGKKGLFPASYVKLR